MMCKGKTKEYKSKHDFLLLHRFDSSTEMLIREEKSKIPVAMVFLFIRRLREGKRRELKDLKCKSFRIMTAEKNPPFCLF